MSIESTQLDLTAYETNAYGESYFPAINHGAFAKSSSEDVLTPYYQKYLDDEEAVYIVIGTDSGLLKHYIEKHHQHPFSNFVFIELEEVLQALDVESDGLESLKDNERNCWVFKQAFDLFQLNQAFGHYVIRRRVHLVKSLAVMDAKPGDAYFDLWEKFEVAFSNYLRSEFNSQSTKVFEEQRLLNLADNQIPAIELGAKLEGRDAIILGGGPTLDDSIDWIRENQDKLIIFAAARVANRMEREGILVDFFVTVDPFPWSFDNSKAVLKHAQYSVLVHSFHAQHRLVSQWSGLSCYMGQRFGWKEESDRINFDAPGPTVTNSALHIAATLGAKRLFLAGIDFCFAKGKTHESSSVEAQHDDAIAHHGKAKLEDNEGNWTETSDDFYGAKSAMENMIKYYLAHKPHLEFINLGLHSAKMENVIYRPVKSLSLSEQTKVDLMEEMKLDLTLSVDEQQSLANETLKTLKQQKKRFTKLLDYSCDAVDLVEKIYDPNGRVVDKHAKKIQKLQKIVVLQVGQDGDFLASYQAALFSDSFKPLVDEKAMSNDEVTEQLNAFFGGMKSVSQAFLDLIEKALERTQTRLQELDAKSLPSELFESWQKWGEFGRALQWKSLHGVEHLDSNELETLESAITQFNEEFERTDHQYQQMLDQNLNNVSKILSRANNAFAKKDDAEIESIIQHVKGLESSDESQKQDFVSLLNGMKLELLEQPVEAFNLYEPIQQPVLKHIALKKMLPIAVELQDYEVALTVLERLVKINIDYMVPYADMLKVLGNTEGAAEVLLMYLQKNPEKLSVKNKLAQFYLELGQKEHVRVLTDQVLRVDANNTAALQLQEIISNTSQ